MTISLKHNGVWKDLATPAVKRAGVWQPPREVFVKNAGVWQSVWVNAMIHTISVHQLHLNLRSYLLGQGWDGVSAAIVTIAPGVYIWSDSTATPALDMGGAFPGGLTLINNGFIMGKGGDGGYLQADRVTYVAPSPGGPAIALTGPISIDNAGGYIGGGGGGGASASGTPLIIFGGINIFSPGGGGAGGGRGGPRNTGTLESGTTIGGFGAGGLIGQVGAVASGANSFAGQTIAPHGGAGGSSGIVVQLQLRM